jgi:hypothetical protein
MKKSIVLLSMAQFNHIISALELEKRNGEYYGDKEQFWKRHDMLYNMLVFERDELTAKIVLSKESLND